MYIMYFVDIRRNRRWMDGWMDGWYTNQLKQNSCLRLIGRHIPKLQPITDIRYASLVAPHSVPPLGNTNVSWFPARSNTNITL